MFVFLLDRLPDIFAGYRADYAAWSLVDNVGFRRSALLCKTRCWFCHLLKDAAELLANMNAVVLKTIHRRQYSIAMFLVIDLIRQESKKRIET